MGNRVASAKASQAFTLGGTAESTGPWGGGQDLCGGAHLVSDFPSS